MFCRFCGYSIEDESKFCSKCGKAVIVKREIKENKIVNESSYLPMVVISIAILVGIGGVIWGICYKNGEDVNSQIELSVENELPELTERVELQEVVASVEDDSIESQIIVKQGDLVTGVIEKRFIKSDDIVGGTDTEYYVLVFDNTSTLELFDIEQGEEYIVEDCTEIAIYAPGMGNTGIQDLEQYIGSRISCNLYASESYTRMGIIGEAIDLKFFSEDSVKLMSDMDYTKIRESVWDSGMVQIGEDYCYIGEKLSTWLSGNLCILNNTTVYDECVVLGVADEPICRVYITADDSLMLEDAIVESVWFGILYDSTITQSRAKNVLENPPSIIGAGGISIGMDYEELENKLGVAVLEETSDNTIITAIYKSENSSYFLDIDRITGKVCGVAYGTGLYW